MSEIILPSGYKKVDYIQRTTNQYIDTGVVPNSTTMMQTKINMYETTGGMIIGYSNSTSDLYRLFNYSNNFYFDIWQDSGVNRINGGSWPNNTIIEIEFGNHYVKDLSTNTTIISGTTIDNKIVPDTIRIFNNSDSANGCIYYLKIYDNSNLVRDFIPCRNSDGVAGLYDIINNQFYHSASGTEFKAPVDIKHLKPGDVIDFDYTGAVQSITLPQGTYKLECWGAQGGYRSSASYGGKGGYSKGTITLTEKTPIYVYVGGSGNSGGSNGGFNGGGSRSNYPGGGGGSDIRIGTDSLYARVIVAGGGGSDGASNKNGMYGGGSSGGSASQNYGQGGGGGTQTSGGSGNKGSFGKGGVGKYQSSGYAGAGGGGWYGGGGSTPDGSGDDDRGGGGGSGYVYTASSASNYPNGCLLNSSLYLTDTQLSAGNQSFLAPDGTNETGHSGDGYCRITVIECKTNIPVFCKVDSQIKLVQSMWFKFNNKLYKVGNDSYNLGDIMNYQYSGNSQTVQLQPGIYKLECWGAQGGTYSSYRGGAGGYSSGIINITEPTTLYINVGGQPSTNTSTGSSQGGFNGGGNGCCRYYSGVYTYGQGGGGATDIRINSNSLYSRVIVAGGGGGSASKDDFSLKYGGGTSGGSASGYVGTQTSSGTNGSFGQGGAATTSGTNYKYGSGGGGGGWYGGGAYNSYSDSDSGLRSYNGGGSGYVYTANTSSNYPSGCTLAPKYYLTNASTIAGNQSMPAIEGANETGHSGHGHCRITKVNLKRYGMFIKQNNTWNYIQF